MNTEIQTQEAYNTIQNMLTTDNQVDARKLHQALGSQRKFTDWIKERIEQGGFIEDEEVFHNFVINPSGGRPRHEYTVLPDVAKEISLMEGTETGRQIRRYFIIAEKQVRQLNIPIKSGTGFIEYNGATIRIVTKNNIEWFYYNDLLKALGFTYRAVNSWEKYGDLHKHGLYRIINRNGLNAIHKAVPKSVHDSDLVAFLNSVGVNATALTTDKFTSNKKSNLLLLAEIAKQQGNKLIVDELINRALKA